MRVDFTSHVAAATAAIEREGRVKAFDSANAIRNAWLVRLSGQRSGRQYRIPGTQRFYTASAPGESPASRLGDLRREIAVQETTDGDLRGYEVGSPSKVAVYLEYGTRRIAPRPHLRPALDDAREEVDRIFGTDWRLE